MFLGVSAVVNSSSKIYIHFNKSKVRTNKVNKLKIAMLWRKMNFSKLTVVIWGVLFTSIIYASPFFSAFRELNYYYLIFCISWNHGKPNSICDLLVVSGCLFHVFRVSWIQQILNTFSHICKLIYWGKLRGAYSTKRPIFN